MKKIRNEMNCARVSLPGVWVFLLGIFLFFFFFIFYFRSKKHLVSPPLRYNTEFDTIPSIPLPRGVSSLLSFPALCRYYST